MTIAVSQYEQHLAQYAAEEARSEQPLRWNLGDYLNHWSPSSLTMLRRCPYQWQQRYIKGRKERPGEAPTIGTAVHAALERNFGQKIDSHEDLPTAELVEWYDEVGFPTVVLDQQERAGSEVLWDTDPDKARTRGRAMLADYHGYVSPRVQPLSVEGEFTTHEFGLAVPVVGRFDITKAESVIDIKTGKSKQSKPKSDWTIQAGVYAFVEDKPVEFHSLTSNPRTKHLSVEIVTPLESEAMLVHPTFAQRRQLAYSVRAISAEACLYMEMYGPDLDWPMHGVHHSWACSYCGFRPTCPAWEGIPE